MTLDQLNAAATGLLPCPFCGGVAELDHYQPFRAYRTGEPLDQPAVYCTECSAQIAHYPKDVGLDRTDTAELVMAAWNTRTGQLVAVADDAVDRVARAIGTSLAYDIGMDVRAGSLTDDEKRKVATKAIAAMKDTQP